MSAQMRRLQAEAMEVKAKEKDELKEQLERLVEEIRRITIQYLLEMYVGCTSPVAVILCVLCTLSFKSLVVLLLIT